MTRVMSQSIELEGKKLEIQIALPREQQASAPGRSKLFVGGIPFHCTNEDLKRHFGQFAHVLDAFVVSYCLFPL